MGMSECVHMRVRVVAAVFPLGHSAAGTDRCFMCFMCFMCFFSSFLFFLHSFFFFFFFFFLIFFFENENLLQAKDRGSRHEQA